MRDVAEDSVWSPLLSKLAQGAGWLSAAMGAMSATEIAAYTGASVAIASFLLQRHYKRKEDEREAHYQAQHDAREARREAREKEIHRARMHELALELKALEMQTNGAKKHEADE